MNHNDNLGTFQWLIFALQSYWSELGCAIMQPLDLPVGAGTFHPATFLRAIGPEPWRTAYVQPSRRPTDGRYGQNPNRTQHFYQFQVLLKPAPVDIQDLYLASLQAINIDPLCNDIRFVEDNWASPTLGAWGLGWEIWLNGLEIGQFTYFQQVGGLECQPISGEITYGLERLAMALQGVDNFYELLWSKTATHELTYHELFRHNEQYMSKYNFILANITTLNNLFTIYTQEATELLSVQALIPAYEMILHASHTFNILDARRALSVTDRQNHILIIRNLANQVAQQYYNYRKEQGFPLLSEHNLC